MLTIRVMLVLAFLAVPLRMLPAEESSRLTATANRVYQIPYRLTIPKHIVVRTKINGKGPFNLILDTGAPALILATKAAKKAGVEADANGWALLENLVVEGGLKLQPTRARIETPFQLEGMNGMGLAGLEIHGLLGYQALARYRMEIDFTRDKMTWTEQDYTPRNIQGLGGKGGGQGGLEVFGSIMKTIGSVLGRKPLPEISIRGFLGLSLEDQEGRPVIRKVLAGGPAAAAGLAPGDAVLKIQGRGVTSVADVLRLARRISTGATVSLTIERDGKEKEITFVSSEGI
ncbi:MAG: PDZ domain-containing protein [Gemmataceae bacterium]